MNFTVERSCRYACSWISCHNLPGVATSMGGLYDKSRSCFGAAMPPTMGTMRTPVCRHAALRWSVTWGTVGVQTLESSCVIVVSINQEIKVGNLIRNLELNRRQNEEYKIKVRKIIPPAKLVL